MIGGLDLLASDPFRLYAMDMLWLDSSSSASQLLEEFNFHPDLIIIPEKGCQLMSYWLRLWKARRTDVASGHTIHQLLAKWILDNPEPQRPKYNDRKNCYDYERLRSATDAGEIDMETLARILIDRRMCSTDVSGQYVELWPFNGNTQTLCQSGNLIGQPCLNQSTWCPVHCCRFNHERFWRKQEKKRLRRMRMMGLKIKYYIPPMPGRWVD